jgi:L-lactate dehydrogenase complex protein LldE
LKVGLFIPCIVEQFHPQVGEATARVLAKAGCSLDYPPDQTCCGQLQYKTGNWKSARDVARHFIKVFEEFEAVVAPSGSCVAMVRKYYPELFRDDPRERQRAQSLAQKTFELTEFLVRVLGVEDLGARWRTKAVYHDSCQVSRALGIKEEPRRLLSKVEGLELVEMEQGEVCCGFGGSFSLQFPEISEAMVAEKASHILATGAETLISAEISCLMNIGGYLKRKGASIVPVHIAEVLVQRGK